MFVGVHLFEQRDLPSVPRLGAHDEVAGIIEIHRQQALRSFGVALEEPLKRIEALWGGAPQEFHVEADGVVVVGVVIEEARKVVPG